MILPSVEGAAGTTDAPAPPRRLIRSLVALWPLAAGLERAIALIVGVGVVTSLVEGGSIAAIVALVYALLGAGPQESWVLGTASGKVLLVVALVVLVLVQGALAGWYGLLTHKVSSTVADRTRQALFANFLTVDYAYVARRGIGSLITALDWEALLVPDALNQLSSILINSCAILVYGVYFVVLSWRLALLAVLFAVPLLAAMLVTGRLMRAPGVRRLRAYEAHGSIAIAALNAMRTLRLHDAQADIIGRERAASNEIAAADIAIARRQGWIKPVRQAAMLAVGAGFLAATQSVGIATAALLATLAVLIRLLPHLVTIEAQATSLAANAAAIVNVADTIAETTRRRLEPGSLPYDGQFRSVTFDRVSFTYPGQPWPSLDSVQLNLRRGSVTAVTGPSGSGKTTVVNLLARLSDPASGAILVDGRPLPALSRADWLRHTAFAGQDVELVDGTILSNVALGRPDVGVTEARDALRLAGALDFVDRLPQGLDSVVGDRGLRLSGGQRQRIALARALARRPTLLVLDEAANAVDPAMETAILTGLRRAQPSLTLIVVTHRGQFAGADQVVTMEGGRLTVQETRHAS